MNPERREFLNLLSPPGRLTATETAWKLGFEPEHIPILVGAGLLQPLGHPPASAMKFFLTAEVEQKKNDAKWMTSACEAIRLKWKEKNARTVRTRLSSGDGGAVRSLQSRQEESHA
jgi:hypothetical protein